LGNVLSEKTRSAKQFALFAELTPPEFELVIASAREKRFDRRETIFTEGDPVRQVTMVLSGFVKVTQMGLNGNEVILRLSGAGEIVGSYRVCTSCSHCATAQAVQPCVALVWDAVTFEKLLARIPAFRRNTVRALEERLLEMEQRFREVSTEKVGSRLSSELVRISDRLRRTPDNGHLEITLSRAELAQLTGTTLFTVSRLLCQWQTQGIVRVRRESVLVQDFAALAQISQTEERSA
jgi:CRP-like cAMP-binding protein